MWNWNTVYLPYCDGGSFSGNAPKPVKVGKQTIYYRGALILKAVKNDLVKHYGFNHATDLVISGASAGALATYHHADWWAAQAPHAKAAALPDCGFFLDWPKNAKGRRSLYNTAMLHVSSKMHPVYNARCAAAHHGAARANCLFAEHLAPFIKTPIFVMQARYDSWQQAHVLASNSVPAVQSYGNTLLARLRASVLAQPKNAAFVDSCSHHTGAYNSIAIGSVTVSHAFNNWYTKTSIQSFYFQDSPFPCPSCCNNGWGNN